MSKKKSKKSLIDELLDLRFSKEDLKNKEKIISYLTELYDELSEAFSEMDESDEEESSEFTDGSSHQLKGDDFPDDMVPFVVIKKRDTYVDYVCPHCNSTNKFLLRNFDKSQYKEHTCPECHKEFLMKGEFTPSIRSFVCHTPN